MVATLREVLESRPIRDLTSGLRVVKGQRVLLLIEAICLRDEERPRRDDGVLEHVSLLEFDRSRLVAILPEHR